MSPEASDEGGEGGGVPLKPVVLSVFDGSGILCASLALTMAAVLFALWIAILRRSIFRCSGSVMPHWLRIE